MLSHIVFRLLHLFSPERAHHIGVFLLRVFQGLTRWRPVKRIGANPIHIAAVSRIPFANRLGLAAGFDKNAEIFAGLSRLGFGFIEVGSVTPLPQPGNPAPRIWRLPERALVNALGFNNVGLERFRRNIIRLKKSAACPVIANIGKGKDTPNERAVEDYEKGFRALEHLVDGFVVNVSSPNTPQLFRLQTTAFLEGLSKILPRELPVLVKLSPDLSNEELKELCRMVSENKRLSGLVLTNTSRKLAEEAGRDRGGLSGPPLFSRALECVGTAKEILKDRKTLIGVGGVSSRLDYQRMRAAGADLVEVYTGFVYHGPRWLKEMAKEATDL